MAWLLDTMILSEGRRPRPEPKVTAFYETQPLDRLYVSVVTFPVIRFGIELMDNPTARAELNDWFTLKLRPAFEGRVLPLTEDIMLKWRLLLEEGRKTGHTFSQPDLIIAETAIHHGHIVVTRDRSQYDKARVPVFNPWEQ
jgi:predicted nucleic acid-binding protein